MGRRVGEKGGWGSGDAQPPPRPVHLLASFSDAEPPLGVHPLLRPRVARDVELARIRTKAASEATAPPTAAAAATAPGSSSDATSGSGSRSGSEMRMKTPAKSAKTRSRVGKEKVDELLSPAAARAKRVRAMLGKTSPSQGAAEGEQPPAGVVYRFQEGFTNAVRRPVFLSDFV